MVGLQSVEVNQTAYENLVFVKGVDKEHEKLVKKLKEDGKKLQKDMEEGLVHILSELQE